MQAARCLCYLSVSNEDLAQMVKEHAADAALVVLAKRCKSDSPVEGLVASTLQYMSWRKIAQNSVLQEGAAKLLG
jgi:hypothetical protein